MHEIMLQNNYEVHELLEKCESLNFDRDEIRDHAKENIAKIQKQNKHEFDRKQKKALSNHENDLVAYIARFRIEIS